MSVFIFFFFFSQMKCSVCGALVRGAWFSCASLCGWSACPPCARGAGAGPCGAGLRRQWPSALPWSEPETPLSSSSSSSSSASSSSSLSCPLLECSLEALLRIFLTCSLPSLANLMRCCSRLAVLIRDWDLLWRELARIHVPLWLPWIDVAPGGGRYFHRFQRCLAFKRAPTPSFSSLDPVAFIHGCGLTALPRSPNFFGACSDNADPVIVLRGRFATLTAKNGEFLTEETRRGIALKPWKTEKVSPGGFFLFLHFVFVHVS
jgi:hypothetical protein